MGNHIAEAKNSGSYQEGIVDLAGLKVIFKTRSRTESTTNSSVFE